MDEKNEKKLVRYIVKVCKLVIIFYLRNYKHTVIFFSEKSIFFFQRRHFDDDDDDDDQLNHYMHYGSMLG